MRYIETLTTKKSNLQPQWKIFMSKWVWQWKSVSLNIVAKYGIPIFSICSAVAAKRRHALLTSMRKVIIVFNQKIRWYIVNIFLQYIHTNRHTHTLRFVVCFNAHKFWLPRLVTYTCIYIFILLVVVLALIPLMCRFYFVDVSIKWLCVSHHGDWHDFCITYT